MPVRVSVRVTANFEANLDAVREYWETRDAPAPVARLVEEIERAIEALERHPRLGRDFLARSAASLEARDKIEALREAVGGREIREYIAADILMLYLFDPAEHAVTLLSVRHHRELTFDFDGFWEESRRPGPVRP